MAWPILAVITVVTASVATLYQRLIMKEKDSDPVATALAFQLILTIVIGIYALTQGFHLPPFGAYPLQFIISSLGYGVGTLLMFQAFQYLEASEVTIIFSVESIIAVIGSVLVLGESFSLIEVVGTVLVLASVFLVNARTKWKLNQGVWYTFAWAFCYGVALISDRIILRTYDVPSYVTVISFLPAIVIVALRPKAIAGLRRFGRLSLLKTMMVMGIIYGIQAITYYTAVLAGAGISRMTVITRSSIILTVILGIIFLAERKHLWLKLSAAVLVTVGVLLLR